MPDVNVSAKHASMDVATSQNPTQSPARAVAAAVLILGFTASLALNWPGQLSYDSVVQLRDGRIGHYNPWHPPVMSWMLGLADRVLPGTGLFVLFDELLLTASLLALLWIAPRVSRASAIAAAVLVALPQVVLYQGIVWKDVLFADCGIAGFAVLAFAGARWRNRAQRWLLICSAFVLFALAALARQNGSLAIPCAAVALFVMARREGDPWQRAIAIALAATVLAAAAVYAAGALLAERTGGVTGLQGQWKLLQLYDLVGEVKLDPGVRLGDLAHGNPDLEKQIRSAGAQLYTPARNDTLTGSTTLQKAFVATSPAVVASQWNHALLENPGTYLRTRMRVFSWLFLTPDPVQCDACYTGVDGPPQVLRELGLVRRFRSQDKVLADYASYFVHTPIFSHVTFALLALILIVLLIRRRRTADLAIVALLGCALAFALSFFVIAIACDYRYLLFLDLAAIAGAFYCVATCLPVRTGTQ